MTYDQRKADSLRPVTIDPFPTPAAGSVVIAQGNTRVLCTASLAEDAPKWIERDEQTGKPVHGWVTAEYNMLPGSTPDRKRRGPNSRGTEIQRLIGRTLRAAVDLGKMPGVAITCDCDVLYADGGTRTAAITGAYVALAQALRSADIADNPLQSQIAAVSVGIVGGQPMVDLDYQRDVNADVDLNLAMNDAGQFIEIQGTGEKATFSRNQLETLLDLGAAAIGQLLAIQRTALSVR